MSQTAKTLLQWGVAELVPILGDAGHTDARILLAYALGVERGLLGASLSDVADLEQIAVFQQLIKRRSRFQPVSQIIGRRGFWGRDFEVTEAVLDPRPDTETLIEEVLKVGPFNNILDLGTGTGCILLTLLAEWPNASGLGVDCSVDALQVAGRNAKQLGVTSRAKLKPSNWFADISGKFDLIVSNPPYITAKAMQTLAPDVRNWEPRIALTPEGDGLDAYRQIAAKAAMYLRPNGRMFLEIGWDQANAVLTLFKEAGFVNGTCIQDMAGKDRVISFQ